MRKRYLAFLSIVILAVLFVVTLPGPTGRIAPNTPPKNSLNDGDMDKIDSVKVLMDKMSLEEKIGQLVMVGIDGLESNDHSQKMITQYHVGGFILLKKNINDTTQMLSLINSLKRSNKINKNPLFLAIDEEGGRISRMPDEFLKMPPNQQLGKLNNGELSYKVGEVIGKELKAFGLNINFAPVLDINSNPQNTVIGDRAFGDNASLVSELGIQTMKGLQSQNIISVVKHFPGHGDTTVDSHIGLPAVNHGMNRLKNLELVPFSKAIDHNVDAIMMAHILLPKIDAENPASFSENIMSDILRKEMKFEGVVITDDMTMGAIVKNYDIGEAAVKAIKAGSDIVLVCHDFAKEEAVLTAILKAAKVGILAQDRIDESVYRILRLKQKYSLSDEVMNSVDTLSINEEIEDLFNDYIDL